MHPPHDTAPADLFGYDAYLVAFSGGKDCLASVLRLLELGVDPAKIELHHHAVDGDGPTFMDWPCTESYCRAVARALGLRIYFSFREGGFLREMSRHNAPTAAVVFETPEGDLRRVGGASNKLGTRGLFPQVSADLRVRYCSAYLKIGVMDAVLCNQDRFLGARTLVITGERAEESPGRALYAPFEPHRADNRTGRHRKRHVDHWRPVHSWAERAVWDIIRRHGINPHVAYQLGWSRLSCRTCVFLEADGWASIRVAFPRAFREIATREAASGRTIKRHASVVELADAGTPYPAVLSRPDLVAQAEAGDWTLPILVPPSRWQLPPGAFRANDGPS